MSLWDNIFKKLCTLVIALFYKLVLYMGWEPQRFGIHPRDWSQWIGIFTVPLVHGSPGHLISNLVAFVALSSLLFIIYDRIAFAVFVLLWIGTGLLMFFFARGGYYHIGASGVVYALIFFLGAAGVIVPRASTITVTLIVALFYGGSVWGMLPIENGVSWDGHLLGAIAGVAVAILFQGQIKSLFRERRRVADSFKDEGPEADEYSRFGD
jgi:membrane associated rhomboid family serine protease